MSKSQIDKLTQKWNASGLLDGLSPEKQRQCAVTLDGVASLLIKNLKQLKKTKFKFTGYMSEDVAATLLPIARRLYDMSVVIPSAKQIYNHYIKFLCDDPEAFFVSSYVEDYAKQLRKQK